VSRGTETSATGRRSAEYSTLHVADWWSVRVSRIAAIARSFPAERPKGRPGECCASPSHAPMLDASAGGSDEEDCADDGALQMLSNARTMSRAR
jgi:hypothetical protein